MLHLADRIVFADDLAPADAAQLENQGVAALLTEFGGATSHTAILARSLGVPAVVGLHRARPYLREGEMVIVDGREGLVIIAPDHRTIRYFENRQREIARHHARRRRLHRGPAVTADGQRVVLQANVELAADLENARRLNADGIGLFRTEGLYMNRRAPPDEEEQLAAYAALVNRMRGAPVTIRTMDLGADKQVDGVRPGAPATSNPALGLRAVRLCLREPALFRTQLRAILRASALGPVRMLVPMLSTIQEVAQVKATLRECQRQLDRRGEPYDREMPLGGMIEVPAAAVCADAFAAKLDFLSIGTNDLIQYTIAIDRVDDEVNYLYDPLHPAVLRLVKMTIDAGRAHGVPVAMCGEMAGDARYTRLLLGLGLREFSVHPNSLLEVKQIIGRSEVSEMRRLARRVLQASKESTRLALIERMNAATS
jgi:phosphotransferase system enzyme I (PtsI)